MVSFYRGLRAGLTKPEALRQARLETMRQQIRSAVTGEQESLASPYFWAPFYPRRQLEVVEPTQSSEIACRGS